MWECTASMGTRGFALFTALCSTRPRLESKLRVAVLVAAGYNETEIAGRLGLSLGDVRMAVRQLERVAPHL